MSNTTNIEFSADELSLLRGALWAAIRTQKLPPDRADAHRSAWMSFRRRLSLYYRLTSALDGITAAAALTADPREINERLESSWQG
jgi:hypothetical protein